MTFGAHRIGAGWIGIGIAAGVLVVVTPPLLGAGAAGPLLVVAPILLLAAARCATTRTVAIDAASRTVGIERRLLGLGWTRDVAPGGAGVVAAECYWLMSRHARRDGTLPGDQRFLNYRIILDGRPRIRLDVVSGDVAAAERTALRVAAALGLAAERRGYTREATASGRGLAVRRKGLRERIA